MIKFAFAVVLLVQACYGLDSRITDGETAEPGAYPYQVSVQWGLPPILKYRHICGGSIVNERFVLTAGHCILRLGKLKVVAGKHYINKKEPTFEQVAKVAKSYVHEGYKGGVAEHDIALLKLSTPLVLNDRVAAVHLPPQDSDYSGIATLTGWGSTSKNIFQKLPVELQVADLPLVTNNECRAILEANPPPAGENPKLFDTQLCTVSDTSVSACSGDSGGPLVQTVELQPVQVGIVSWGFIPCGNPGIPSVFTRVSSYTDWILKKVNA